MLRRSLLLLVLSCAAPAQTYTRQNIGAIFGFENNAQAGVFPAGWSGVANNTIFSDNQVAHSGKWSARIERTASSTQTFSTITQAIPVDFAGKTIVWRGWVKMQNVADSKCGDPLRIAEMRQARESTYAALAEMIVVIVRDNDGVKVRHLFKGERRGEKTLWSCPAKGGRPEIPDGIGKDAKAVDLDEQGRVSHPGYAEAARRRDAVQRGIGSKRSKWSTRCLLFLVTKILGQSVAKRAPPTDGGGNWIQISAFITLRAT